MEKKTIRLLYPQWQGGDIARLVPEVPDAGDASRGYALGARLLHFLAPQSGAETYEVPVAMDRSERITAGGVLDRDVIAAQTKAALDLLHVAGPDKIVTFGGDCSASVVPFAYLAHKYEGDVAVVWIDAHPDLTLPGDAYTGFHAMALAACLGLGEPALTGQLPARIDASRVLIAGVRDWERDEVKERARRLGVAHLTPDELRADASRLTAWLAATGASRVVVHLDLDVLDPSEIVAAVGQVPDGLRLAEVVRMVRQVADACELVGLTVAEPMPRTALLLRSMLSQLPLL